MSGARCRSCKAFIIWMKTAAGKNMPVDADSVPFKLGADGHPVDPPKLFDPETMTSHFATCPNADTHRKPRESADG